MAIQPLRDVRNTRHVAPEPTGVEARQGVISGRVLLVLVVSLVLAAVAMVAGYLAVR